MKIKNGSMIIKTIDTHTGGDPTRVVISGLPNVEGETMVDKRNYFEKNLDYIRTALLLEPRGHKDMYGALLLDPTHPEADVGVIFMSNLSYISMCGHGTMGLITALIESGTINYTPGKPIILDTPAGLVNVNPTLNGNRVENVAIQNVPSFLWGENYAINLPSIGNISVDVSFGGNFYAYVDADKFGINLEPSNHDNLSKLGVEIIDTLEGEVKVKHPLNEKLNKIDHVIFVGDSKNDNVDTKNVAIFGEGQVARSACGTGLCAQMARQYSKNIMDTDETYVTESIIETPFYGRILEETKVGEFDSIVPEVNGNAYITGKHEFIIHPEDELKNGFLLK